MNELKYERIDGDLFDISSRIKEIDEDYFLLRDRKSGKVEVHCSGQKGSTYCLTVPYKELDDRTIDFVRSTRRERLDSLLLELSAVV